MSRPAVVKLCQVKMVWVSGMRPLIVKIAGGMDPCVAIMRAAEDERPKAHTVHTPRYAAALAAKRLGGVEAVKGITET